MTDEDLAREAERVAAFIAWDLRRYAARYPDRRRMDTRPAPPSSTLLDRLQRKVDAA